MHFNRATIKPLIPLHEPRGDAGLIMITPERAALVEALSCQAGSTARSIAWAKTRTQGTDAWLFGDDETRFNRNSAGHLGRGVRVACGMHDFTLHDLRHFYASCLIAAGCDVVTVQRSLGHSTPSITLDTYAHLWSTAEDRTRAAAAELMDTAFGGRDQSAELR